LALLVALAGGAVGCGSDGGGGGDGDGGGAHDGGGADGGGADGGAGASCSKDGDCRAYSSYCNARPCQCIPLGADEVDPPCLTGYTVCIVDPCRDKTAFCDHGACSVH
jgi:hypothetical protein